MKAECMITAAQRKVRVKTKMAWRRKDMDECKKENIDRKCGLE